MMHCAVYFTYQAGLQGTLMHNEVTALSELHPTPLPYFPPLVFLLFWDLHLVHCQHATSQKLDAAYCAQ